MWSLFQPKGRVRIVAQSDQTVQLVIINQLNMC